MTVRPARRSGFTLLEMAIVLVALGLVLLLVSATLLGSLRAQRLTARVSHRLITQGELADRFRADVAGATAAPESLREWAAGPACLILAMPGGKHVVYRRHDDELERTEVAGKARSSRTLPLGDDRVAPEFARSADGRVLSLRLAEPPGRGGANRVVEVAAALGGDLR